MFFLPVEKISSRIKIRAVLGWKFFRKNTSGKLVSKKTREKIEK
jgi:hypothetical protein